jgi:ABC-type transport system involved in cytochrome c biogenesis permease subunit
VIDILTVAHLGSAVLALVVTGLLAAGFVRLAWNARGLVRHMAVGILAIHSAVFLHTLYRDIVPWLFGGSAFLFAPGAALAVALVLNTLIVVAGWHGLRALHLAIPEPARRRYTILTAALYPPLRRR